MSYKLFWNSGSGTTFTTLESNITSTSFNVTSLSPGTTYKFKVKSMNAFGYSVDSLETQVLAA